MKKILSLLSILFITVCASAQMYIWHNGQIIGEYDILGLDSVSFRKIVYHTVGANDVANGEIVGLGNYPEGVTLNVTAEPARGYIFKGWCDTESTENPRAITVTKDITLCATFVKDTFTIATYVANEAMGSVTETARIPFGEYHTITATANEGYRFASWSDGYTENPRTIVVEADKNITALFITEIFNITTAASNDTYGYVVGAGTYPYGSTISLYACTEEGGKFTQWSDGSTENPRRVTITGDSLFSAEFTSKETTGPEQPTYEYVDLGLSVKWATFNVGATKPEEYGDYFAWGETTIKENYDWSTYKYGTKDNITKYNSTDNKTILDPEDDAATANWGKEWRTPTKEEQDELMNKCTWTWTTQNDVKGYLVTSKVEGYTDRSIFLPAAGYKNGKQLYDAEKQGYQWSSSIYSDSKYANCVLFSSAYKSWYMYNRFGGYSIRPVYKEETTEPDQPQEPQEPELDYELRVLTFEDADAKFTPYEIEHANKTINKWSDLIDSEQYGGDLTYNGYAGGGTYYWYDEGNTELFHSFTTPYWGGGHAISNYVLDSYSTLPNDKWGWYEVQFSNMLGGNNGSKNFCVHNGYIDFFNSTLYAAALPTLEFADGVERVIDHMYVTNICYVLNSLTYGDGFNSAANDTTEFRIVAFGFDAEGNQTGSTVFKLCEGKDKILNEWKKWDLSVLGKVAKVSFNMNATADQSGSYGLNAPAYFAYDDVAVRFEKSTTVEPEQPQEPELTYDIRILTFEDKDAKFEDYTLVGGEANISTWSDLIDAPQYGGALLYPNYATGAWEIDYTWYDENNTEIRHTSNPWGYATGGQVISNYASKDYGYTNDDRNTLIAKWYGEDYVKENAGNDAALGWFSVQLTTPTNGGHSGENFAVHFGYVDFFSMSDVMQGFEFEDGVARVIDHMYVTNTNYTLNQLMYGVGSEAGNTFGGNYAGPTANSWYKITAYGYADADDEEPTSSVDFYLLKDMTPVTDWTKWDLSVLGKVAKVRFNMFASEDMSGQYGLTVPAYFAYDDVAVRFDKK
ncbi:MAG: DUF4465 domain-containing protein [Paludibacteraceae bacterium]|nr:DUF4465 domain-containing protein [Paludibacteraceae bacterium]